MASPRVKLGLVESEIARGSNLSVIKLIDYLLDKACNVRASDIHIDPTPTSLRVRLRIDGVLQESYAFPKQSHTEIIARIKVLTKLRTDEHQSSQDGRFRYQLPNKESVDVRVSIVPTHHGENAVLRLLLDRAEYFSLETLGFSEHDEKRVKEALSKRTGMILVTGPTGSGKTTTLYTLIKMVSTFESSIVTIEDPIEYAIEGVRQIQVNGRSGLTFANGLRSILRQNPDIIMVGEVRDSETAAIAVNTALTGHLLLSTLHTNDAATTLPRLLDMGVAPYLVSSTINISIGQRLVRKVCGSCKEVSPVSSALLDNCQLLTKKKILKQSTYKGRGCELCQYSGYFGRISINEVLVANDEIRDAIIRNESASQIKRLAIANGMTTFFEDGLSKVEGGLTTLEEVFRVAPR